MLLFFKCEGAWLIIMFGLIFDVWDGIILEHVRTWGCGETILDGVKNDEHSSTLEDLFIITELLPTEDGLTHIGWLGFVIITLLIGLLF